jgi:hypothetical protein
MRSIGFAFMVSALFVGMGSPTPSYAQSIRLGPDGVEVRPPRGPDRRPVVVQPPPRDELRERMLQLRQACEEEDKRSCVRLGILIGENRAKREAWRRENPEVFFYER